MSAHGPSEESFNPSPKSLLTWKLANLNLRQNFYKESDIFSTGALIPGNHNEEVGMGALKWRLFISKTNDRECNIGVKCLIPDGSSHLLSKLVSLLSWVKIVSSREKAPPIESDYDVSFSHLLISSDRS